MVDGPETRESLLIRVRDSSDRDAWDQFVSIYQPVVYRLARLRGMQDADAQDLTQRVLLSISQSIARWEPAEGTKFRHWLAKVAKNAVINALSRAPKDRGQGGSAFTKLMIASEAETEQSYELEYQRQLYRRAADIVRHRADETTWLAFSLTMIDGKSIETAAKLLDIQSGTVYAARSRIIRRLRDEVRKLNSADISEPTGGEQNAE